LWRLASNISDEKRHQLSNNLSSHLERMSQISIVVASLSEVGDSLIQWRGWGSKSVNWEAFEVAGEWVGAIAVIITLIYLAQKIHQKNSSSIHRTRQRNKKGAPKSALFVFQTPLL
jgi:hypothetical protein